MFVGYVDVNVVSYYLFDGRLLLDDVMFCVGDGVMVVLIGFNGMGKIMLLCIIVGDFDVYGGVVICSGGFGVMC